MLCMLSEWCISRFPYSRSTQIDASEKCDDGRERKKEQKKDAKNVPGIRADYARRERCMRVPLLFVDVVGTDVPTNADRMEREENMMLPFSLFFRACLWRMRVSFFLEAERFFLANFLVSSKKKGKRKQGGGLWYLKSCCSFVIHHREDKRRRRK